MSGIYIPGMELPKRDYYFLLTPNGNIYDAGTGLTLTQFTAIPVPDHGRLIDADALEDEFETLVYQDNWYYNALHHAPTIIPADKEELT